jgi:hypothetical protein
MKMVNIGETVPHSTFAYDTHRVCVPIPPKPVFVTDETPFACGEYTTAVFERTADGWTRIE